jgi:hypothetical protein
MVLNGLNNIREILGENWFKYCYENLHPFVYSFTNKAPWSLLWHADLGLKLLKLKSVKRFNSLLNRLKNPQEYISALGELEVATKILKTGYPFELYPKYERKEQDMKVLVEGREIYFEITSMRSPEQSIRASKILEQLCGSAFNSGVYPTCKIHKILSQPRIRELQVRIIQGIEKTLKTGECVEITEPGIIDYLIVPEGKEEEMRKWQAKKNISGCEGPPFEFNEPKRIRKVIERENNQLPHNYPGIVVVYNNNIFERDSMFETLAYELEETVYDHRNLIATAIIWSELAPSEKKTLLIQKLGNHIAIKKTKYRLLQDNILIILNRYSSYYRFKRDIEKIFKN